MQSDKTIPVDFPDMTKEIVDEVFKKYAATKNKYSAEPVEMHSFKKMRRNIMGNMLHENGSGNGNRNSYVDEQK